MTSWSPSTASTPASGAPGPAEPLSDVHAAPHGAMPTLGTGIGSVAVDTRTEQATQTQAWMVATRRHLQQNPDVGLALPGTHDFLADVLTELGLAVERHDSAGLTVRIDGTERDGKVSVLRADMDALPVEERSAVPFRLDPTRLYARVRPRPAHGHAARRRTSPREGSTAS